MNIVRLLRATIFHNFDKKILNNYVQNHAASAETS